MSNICEFLTIGDVFAEMEIGILKRLRSIFVKQEDKTRKEEADDEFASVQSASGDALNTFDAEYLVKELSKISKAVDELKTREEKTKEEGKKSFRSNTLSNAAGGIIAAVVIAAFGLPAIYNGVNARIDGQDKRIDDAIKIFLFEMGQLREDMRSNINQKYDVQEARLGISASPYFVSKLSNVLDNFDIIEKINSISVYGDSKDAIAYDNETKEEIYADELVEQKFLIPYKSGSEDVYFYGQFNKNGHWDGHCVINTYKDGKLERILDADYRDGKLESSQQVFHYVTEYSKEKQDVWAISDRKVFYRSDGSVAYSSGETNLYKRNGDFLQSFDEQAPSENDILNVSRFQSKMDLKLYAYYAGNTSNGRFNDDTGDAYLVYYYEEDMKVKTLYVGKFVDGTINDRTGNAWWITEDEETSDGRYGYYKGKFANGDVVDKRRYEYNISQKRIDEILAETGKDSLGLIWRQVGENKA